MEFIIQNTSFPLDGSALTPNVSWGNLTRLGPDHTEPPGPLPSVAAVLVPLIYAAVCAVGLAGNTLVIYVALRYTRPASATDIYVLNLAVADELFVLGLPFLAVQNALLSWPFGAVACRAVLTVDAVDQFTGVFCLTAMSVDRYLAVARPVRSAHWRRPRVARAVSACVWATSVVVALPVVVFAGVRRNDGTCSIVWPEPAEVWKATFIVYTSAVGFLCPLLVICLCYLLIVIKVRSAGKRVRLTSSRHRKSERKVTRMVVVVVAVFVLCWLPFYTLNIVNLLVVLPGHLRGLYFFVVALSYANSCANPILYGFLSDSFRRGFRKALCRSSRRVENHGQVELQLHPPDRNRRRAGSGEVQGCHEEEKKEEEEEYDDGGGGGGGGAGSRGMCRVGRKGKEGEGAGADVRTDRSPEVGSNASSAPGQMPGRGDEPARPSQAGCTLVSEAEIVSSGPPGTVDHSGVLEVSYL
ncbi:hypothetical protein NHX12_018931 [Muraenolepis orangiensis]|uniref:G-protein coupled receptors family 1 profile domain-containing protein n=1 Tax=Muraenolepis orangiensis TaxID=630683 RepID=A0A9Q0EZX0_9TELE|nr:hypothetical protein NHX12_018931 [Muraenolepis orangiensis]